MKAESRTSSLDVVPFHFLVERPAGNAQKLSRGGLVAACYPERITEKLLAQPDDDNWRLSSLRLQNEIPSKLIFQ